METIMKAWVKVQVRAKIFASTVYDTKPQNYDQLATCRRI